jgi:Protein of unknown function (DUF1580)
MADGVLSETVLRLAQAARRLPVMDGERVHPATLHRWGRSGLVRPDGTRVRLEMAKLGSRCVTSAEALDRFFAALNEDAEPAQRSVTRTAGQRRRASERAGRELEKAGI